MNKSRWTVTFFALWLVFVVSLAIWWMIFTLRTLGRLHEQNPSIELQPQTTMLITEGSVLIVLLVLGGVTLIYYALREQRRFSEIQLFFSTFTHDLKTSITRLVLQGERLSLKDQESEAFQKSLMALEMQLENSLYLAQMDQRGLVLEAIDLKKIVARLHTQWPDLKIQLQGKDPFLADSVALESILKNLISNSLLHGKADEIYLKVISHKPDVQIIYSDNSEVTLQRNPEEFGQKLEPSQKGSGLGLYIVRRWMALQKSRIAFSVTDKKTLQVEMQFSAMRGEA